MRANATRSFAMDKATSARCCCRVEFDHVQDFGVRQAMKGIHKRLYGAKEGQIQSSCQSSRWACYLHSRVRMERSTSQSAVPSAITVRSLLLQGKKLDARLVVACMTPESGLMPPDAGEAAEVRNWLFICESEVGGLLRDETVVLTR